MGWVGQDDVAVNSGERKTRFHNVSMPSLYRTGRQSRGPFGQDPHGGVFPGPSMYQSVFPMFGTGSCPTWRGNDGPRAMGKNLWRRAGVQTVKAGRGARRGPGQSWGILGPLWGIPWPWLPDVDGLGLFYGASTSAWAGGPAGVRVPGSIFAGPAAGLFSGLAAWPLGHKAAQALYTTYFIRSIF